MMRKTMVGCAAVLTAASAFAAVSPLVRWSGDFAETSEKNGYTLKANGNAVAADGSSITISDSATAGVTIDYPSSVRVTVAVRYAGLTAPASQSVLICSSTSGSSDRSGVLLDPMWHAFPIWDHELWENTTNPDRSAPAALPAGGEGCVAYCYYPGRSSPGGCFLYTEWSGDWVLSREWWNHSGVDATLITGCTIGGPRDRTASSTLSLLKDLVIKEIAIYDGLPTAAQLDEAFPGVARQPQPLLRFAADTGVETDANGNVTKWCNQGVLPGEDVVPHGNGGKASTNAITLAQNPAMGPVVRFDKTDFLVAQSVNRLGFTDSDKYLYAVWVVDYPLDPISEEHGFFGVYPEVSSQGGPYPMTGSGLTQTYRTLNFSYYHRATVQFGCVADESQHSSFALDFCKDQSGRRLLSALTTDALSYGYNAAGHDVSYVKDNGGPLSHFEPGKLRIGHSGFYSTDLMRGDIAEIRLYNQPFTAAMRFAVEGELASKYDVDLMPTAAADNSDVIQAETLADCGNDPVAFGDVPSGGVPVAQIPVSATSSGLTVAFDEAPAAEAGTLVYVGNNGLTGAEKVWCVAGAAGAKALPVTLTFDAQVAAAFKTPILYRQKTKDDNWVRVSDPVTVTDAGLTVALPAGWENARYRLMDVSTAAVPAAWFQADKGVTLSDDKVVKWENQGTMGSVLDLGPADGNPGVTVVQNEQFGTSLHFDAAHYLKQIADEQTTLDLKKNVGGTYFVVVDIPDAATYPDQMVFGLYPDQETEDAWSKSWKDGYMFALSFSYNMFYFQHNFFGYSSDAAQFYRKTDRKPGKRLLSLTAAYDFVFGRGQVACVDGLVQSNAYSIVVGNPSISSPWYGNVHPGFLTIGYHAFAPADYTILCGDIAELRVYSKPLSMTEQAAVELELAAKYGFAAKTVGEVDPEAVAAHAVDARVIGAEAFRGPQVTDMETECSDGTLAFAFRENPPLPPATVEEGAGVKSLTYIGSDGGEAAFAPRSGSASVQDFSRTWYVASACPTYGGVLEISCDTTDASEWKYRLSRKANGASSFSRLQDVPVVGDGKVTFTLDALETGTYRLERRPANIGFALVIQ